MPEAIPGNGAPQHRPAPHPEPRGWWARLERARGRLALIGLSIPAIAGALLLLADTHWRTEARAQARDVALEAEQKRQDADLRTAREECVRRNIEMREALDTRLRSVELQGGRVDERTILILQRLDALGRRRGERPDPIPDHLLRPAAAGPGSGR